MFGHCWTAFRKLNVHDVGMSKARVEPKQKDILYKKIFLVLTWHSKPGFGAQARKAAKEILADFSVPYLWNLYLEWWILFWHLQSQTYWGKKKKTRHGTLGLIKPTDPHLTFIPCHETESHWSNVGGQIVSSAFTKDKDEIIALFSCQVRACLD